MHARRIRALLCVVLSLVLAVVLGSCRPSSDGGRGRSPTPRPPATTPAPTPSPSPTESPAALDRLRFAAVGDVGDGSRRQRRVAEAIAGEHDRRPIDVLLLLGDVIYPDGEVGQYREKFADPYESVLSRRIPLLVALGNHDVRTNSLAFQRTFGMPAPYFSEVRGPVEFFVLDTSQGRVDEAQTAWLEKALQASKSPWKVALMHVPLHSSSPYHGSKPGLQVALAGIFERHGVQLVLGAHDHNYERTVPIRGVTYIVSGGGCCPREIGRTAITAQVAHGLSFAVFDVGPETMRVTALDPSRVVLDEASIPRVAAPVPVP